MAHPCIQCGSECYCHGDIDDVIVSHTPRRCEGCGCEELFDQDVVDYPEEEEDFEPCADCDQPDACGDFCECAIKAGLREDPTL